MFDDFTESGLSILLIKKTIRDNYNIYNFHNFNLYKMWNIQYVKKSHINMFLPSIASPITCPF